MGSLCTGYGGLDLAVESVFDAHTLWTSETDDNCQKVITERFPTAHRYGALQDIDVPPPVDIVTAGFPCQPVSQAGRALGVDDERWIWDDIADLVGRMDPQPGLLVLENVPGLLTVNGGHAMGRVVHRLAQLGYVGSYRTVAAADVGACHRRRRVFVVAAHPGRTRRRENTGGTFEDEGQTAGRATVLDHVAGGAGPPRLLPTPSFWLGRRPGNADLTDPGSKRVGTPGHRSTELTDAVALLPTPTAQDSAGSRNATANRKPGHNANIGWTFNDIRHAERWGEYAAAIARHEHALGRPAPEPAADGRLAPRFVEWMLGLPEGWVTDIDGINTTAQLRMLGNGVVPAQAAHAIRVLASTLEEDQP